MPKESFGWFSLPNGHLQGLIHKRRSHVTGHRPIHDFAGQQLSLKGFETPFENCMDKNIRWLKLI
jgi:hypothetical protein